MTQRVLERILVSGKLSELTGLDLPNFDERHCKVSIADIWSSDDLQIRQQ